MKNTQRFQRSKAMLECFVVITMLQDNAIVATHEYFVGHQSFHNDGRGLYRRSKRLRGVYNESLGR